MKERIMEVIIMEIWLVIGMLAVIVVSDIELNHLSFAQQKSKK